MRLQATRMTTETAAALVEAGLASIRGGDLGVDLSDVTEVDSAGVAMLVAWLREATARGGTLVLTHIPPALASLARLYGVDGLLGIAHHPAPA
ncbi:MAG: lipid asymmetry maintenance protein MlaB [Betaproteobacteria bacterium]